MTGRHVWWYFVAFFGFIAAVNASMVALAIHTHSGVITEHPYEEGLAYNKVVEAEQRQSQLGWNGKIDYKEGRLHFSLRDKNKQRITPENATATITRPTRQGLDFTMELKEEATPVTFPAKGLWDVRVDAVYDGVHYQQSSRIVVQ